MIEASNNRLLAVLWYTGNGFIGPCEGLDGPHVEQYGTNLQLGYDHFRVWDDVNPLGFGHEYDELPRGRVYFNTAIRKFVVVGPRRLVGDGGFQDAIMSEYGLPQGTEFTWDEHYG